MRTALLADRLTERGHDVIWWASTFAHMEKRMIADDDTEIEIGPRQKIKALKGLAYRRNVSLRRYLDHMIIAKKFRRQARLMSPPDIIVTAIPDYQLAYQAVKYANKKDVPVIVDVRDKWPDWFLDVIPFSFLRFLVRFGLYFDFRKVRWLLKHADSLVGSSQCYLTWGLERAGRQRLRQDKLIYLGARGQPDRSSLVLSGDFKSLLERLKGKFVVTFIGTFGRYYNPTIMARAARHLKESGYGEDRLVFVIAGDGPAHDEVAMEASGLANVILPGWLDDAEISGLLSCSSVGVIPCNEIVDATPNKAFTYFSAGLPVISSLMGEMEELLDSQRVGVTYSIGDAAELAGLIGDLADRPDLLAELSHNASCLFAREFDADRIYDIYADHIEDIAARTKQR
jgi:glycosyltransferase involved in cell wall biosynthesis